MEHHGQNVGGRSAVEVVRGIVQASEDIEVADIRIAWEAMSDNCLALVFRPQRKMNGNRTYWAVVGCLLGRMLVASILSPGWRTLRRIIWLLLLILLGRTSSDKRPGQWVWSWVKLEYKTKQGRGENIRIIGRLLGRILWGTITMVVTRIPRHNGEIHTNKPGTEIIKLENKASKPSRASRWIRTLICDLWNGASRVAVMVSINVRIKSKSMPVEARW